MRSRSMATAAALALSATAALGGVGHPSVATAASSQTAGQQATTQKATSQRAIGTAIPAGSGDRAITNGVSANLFEWNWPSVGKECTTVLGPAGFTSVQVAPPADSMKRQKLGDGSDTILHPWWEVYQPADYSLNSRMGTQAQFKAMVAACRKAGVKVIVDAVINHMTGQGSVSYSGKTFTKYAYKGMYTPADFHSYPKDCPVAPAAGTGSQAGSIADYNDYRQVFNCELVGLSDLRTQSTKVRDETAGYLNSLLALGVSGFRVDAAKHIGQDDLAAIESRLHRTVDGTHPYMVLEDFPGGPGRLAPAAFTPVGNVLGFDYAYALQAAFQSYNNPPNDGNIGSLKGLSHSGLVGSGKELVFVQNHDTDRNGSTLSLKSANDIIANEFMLAYGYGTPQVYASFAWKTGDDSPPANAAGYVTNTVCDNKTWICTDRNVGILGMVGFHTIVGKAPVANWFDDGVNFVGFGRGHLGYFAVNNEAAAKKVTVQTGLPAGVYCNRIAGKVASAHRCTGSTVTVNRRGQATITVSADSAIAFTVKDRLK